MPKIYINVIFFSINPNKLTFIFALINRFCQYKYFMYLCTVKKKHYG